jgi:hypothetical protein
LDGSATEKGRAPRRQVVLISSRIYSVLLFYPRCRGKDKTGKEQKHDKQAEKEATSGEAE